MDILEHDQADMEKTGHDTSLVSNSCSDSEIFDAFERSHDETQQDSSEVLNSLDSDTETNHIVSKMNETNLEYYGIDQQDFS